MAGIPQPAFYMFMCQVERPEGFPKGSCIKPHNRDIFGYLSEALMRSESPKIIISQILEGIEDKNKVAIVEDRYEAIKKALSEQKEGEIVAILGKGDETSQIFDGKTIHFDDREVAREILKQLGKWRLI